MDIDIAITITRLIICACVGAYLSFLIMTCIIYLPYGLKYRKLNKNEKILGSDEIFRGGAWYKVIEYDREFIGLMAGTFYRSDYRRLRRKPKMKYVHGM